MLVETVAERFSEACGCPEHDITLDHITATIHIEPNGDGESFINFGDWQEEWYFDNCKDIEELKRKTAERFSALPVS